jgi:hypothetical protein
MQPGPNCCNQFSVSVIVIARESKGGLAIQCLYRKKDWPNVAVRVHWRYATPMIFDIENMQLSLKGDGEVSDGL